MGIEKRTHTRFPARLRVVINPDIPKAEGGCVEALTRDLSLGGMFVECAKPPPFGARLSLDVYLPALALPARMNVTVRWSVGPGVGVQFGALRVAETWAINLLASQARKG